MKTEIRFAKESDCERMLELIRELAEYEKSPEEVTVTLAEFKKAGFEENAVWKAFVAVCDGNIEGFALYYIRYSTWKGSRLYLEDFIVTEKMRGQGIGRMLFERVIQETKDHNYKGMVWQVLDWNQPAINFYNKYQARLESGWINASLSHEQIKS
ncbi:GNAT family N-acetyltransferase [Pedobacter arcticus]|uniref:GNAT family N-acetyltransferase n=1 Tax=Pedobacter arcticus TaxID=752140 RepID=UPI000317818D|nr:GNAT family N-acetyltransferase [Pedobacter arcticus]